MSTDIDINYKLNLHIGFLDFVFDSSLEEVWNISDIGKNKEKRKQIDGKKLSKQINNRLNQENMRIKKSLSEKENHIKLNNLIKEVLILFWAITNNNREKINRYLKNKKYHFIIGSPRTAGSYVANEISKAYNFPFTKLQVRIMHDGMPNSSFLRDNGQLIKNAIGWRKPINFYQIIFDIAQFLIYINHTIDNNHIVKKDVGFSMYLPILDMIFNEKAHYVITVRHPAAVAASRKENFAWEPTEDQKEFAFNNWETIYSELLRDGLPKGNITVLPFGNKMESYLKDLIKKNNYTAKTKNLNITSRHYDHEYWQQDVILKRINKIKKIWELHNLNFPVDNQIL
jgi:hypothetical protein